MAAYDAFDSRFPGGSCSGSSAAGLSQAGSNIPHALCGLRPPVPKVDPSGSDHEAWEDYLVTMSDPKTYGTIAEVHALAYVLDQQIRVFNARGGDDFHCEYVANPNASRSVDLVLSCAHYSYAIEPLSEQGFSRDSSDFRQLRHVPGDGACLFHAVARARGDFSDSAASLLRSMAVDYLRSTGGESRLDGAHGGNGICLRELCVENRAQDRQANVGKKAGSDPSVLYYCDNDRRDLDVVFGNPEKRDILSLRLCHAGSVLRLQHMLEMPTIEKLRTLSLAEVEVRIPWVMDIVATSKAADYLESLTLHCGGCQDLAFPPPMLSYPLIFLNGVNFS